MRHDAIQWEGAMVSHVNLTVEGVTCLVYTWWVTFRGCHISVVLSQLSQALRPLLGTLRALDQIRALQRTLTAMLEPKPSKLRPSFDICLP
jgi:hypothetical protein